MRIYNKETGMSEYIFNLIPVLNRELSGGNEEDGYEIIFDLYFTSHYRVEIVDIISVYSKYGKIYVCNNGNNNNSNVYIVVENPKLAEKLLANERGEMLDENQIHLRDDIKSYPPMKERFDKLGADLDWLHENFEELRMQ